MLHSTSGMSPLVFPRVFLFKGDEFHSILEGSRTAIKECIHLINELFEGAGLYGRLPRSGLASAEALRQSLISAITALGGNAEARTRTL